MVNMNIILHEKWSDELMGKPPGGERAVQIDGDSIIKFTFIKFAPSKNVNQYILCIFDNTNFRTIKYRKYIKLFELCYNKMYINNKFKHNQFKFSSLEEINSSLLETFKSFVNKSWLL